MLRTAALTAATLVCFAANSLLCRAALRPGLVDPATFTLVRVASGAVALCAILLARSRRAPRGGSVVSALALFAYAAAFSLAYVRIGAGVGAMILFGAVQLTMVGWSIALGTRPRPLQWIGLMVAFAGLGWIALPGSGAPELGGSVLMACAGFAWGVYSLRARGAGDPLATTAHNFALGLPFAVAFSAAMARSASATAAGIGLAVASGAIASGGGYSLWYAVVPALGATRAAAAQLAVPVLAGLGATAFLGERLSARIAVAGAAVIAGVAVTMRK